MKSCFTYRALMADEDERKWGLGVGGGDEEEERVVERETKQDSPIIN